MESDDKRVKAASHCRKEKRKSEHEKKTKPHTKRHNQSIAKNLPPIPFGPAVTLPHTFSDAFVLLNENQTAQEKTRPQDNRWYQSKKRNPGKRTKNTPDIHTHQREQ